MRPVDAELGCPLKLAAFPKNAREGFNIAVGWLPFAGSGLLWDVGYQPGPRLLNPITSFLQRRWHGARFVTVSCARIGSGREWFFGFGCGYFPFPLCPSSCAPFRRVSTAAEVDVLFRAVPASFLMPSGVGTGSQQRISTQVSCCNLATFEGESYPADQEVREIILAT